MGERAKRVAAAYLVEQVVFVAVWLALVAVEAVQVLEILRRRRHRALVRGSVHGARLMVSVRGDNEAVPLGAAGRRSSFSTINGSANGRGGGSGGAGSGSAVGAAARRPAAPTLEAAQTDVPRLKQVAHRAVVACLVLLGVRVMDPVGAQGHLNYDVITFLGNNVTAIVTCAAMYIFKHNVIVAFSILGNERKRTMRVWGLVSDGFIAVTLVLANALLLARVWSQSAFFTDGIFLWWMALTMCFMMAELQHAVRLLRSAQERFSRSAAVSSNQSMPALRSALRKLESTRNAVAGISFFMVPGLLLVGYASLSSGNTIDEEISSDYSHYTVRSFFLAGQFAAVVTLVWFAWLTPSRPGSVLVEHSALVGNAGAGAAAAGALMRVRFTRSGTGVSAESQSDHGPLPAPGLQPSPVASRG